MQNSLKSLPQGRRNHVFSKSITPRWNTQWMGKPILRSWIQAAVLIELDRRFPLLYNPDNPAVAHDGGSIGLYLMIAGAVILAVIAFSAIKEKQS